MMGTALALMAGAHPAQAQTATAEQAQAAARAAYGPPPPDDGSRKCPEPKPGEEIVVCGELEEQSQFRVQSSSSLDPSAKVKGDVPQAPDLEHKYPGPVVARGCFIPPCPPPMPTLIDLKAIPEAPPGSDADRVGRGLPPLGRDPPRAPPAGVPPTTPAATPPGSASLAGAQ